jgi:hypothetical protein
MKRRSRSPDDKSRNHKEYESGKLTENLTKRSRSTERNKRRQKSVSNERNNSKKQSGSPKRRSLSRSRSPKKFTNEKQTKHLSKSRSRSISPIARKNQDRYRELDKDKNPSMSKNKKPQPVVKLHPTSSDRESSDNEVQNAKSNDKVDEFLQIDKIQETEKELSVLKALKSGLASKVKQNLEDM